MNESNAAPLPGTQEHDLEMARRYRQQGADAPITSDGLPGIELRQVTSPTGGTVQIRKDSTVGAPGATSFTAAQADPGQLVTLEGEISRLKDELTKVHHFDPQTGEPVMFYSGEPRRLREMRLAHLEQVELPAVQNLVAAAQQWRAENVESPLAALVREKEEHEAIHARAQAIAKERQAEAEAARLLKWRASGLGIG